MGAERPHVHALAEPQAAFSALLEQPPFFVDLSAFARDRALSDADATGLLERCDALKLHTANAILAMSATQWLALQAAWNGCAYCGASGRAMQRDCVLPISRGGRYTVDNVVPA